MERIVSDSGVAFGSEAGLDRSVSEYSNDTQVAVYVTDVSTTLADSLTHAPLCPADAMMAVPRCRWDPDLSDHHVPESRFG